MTIPSIPRGGAGARLAFPAFAVHATACAGMLAIAACAGGRAAAPPSLRDVPAPRVTPAGVPLPPPARTVAHVDTLHGVALPDPYRWLEDTLSAEARAWVAAQERHAAAVLARVVARDSLTALYARALADAPTLDRVAESPAGLVFTRWLGDAPSLFVAAADGAGERLLRPADDVAGTGAGVSLRAMVPSPDGRLVALGTTRGGDAGAAVAIVDAVTGAPLADRIPDLLTTTSGTRYEVSWLPDETGRGDAFFYPRLWPGAEGGPPAERLARARQFLHRIGTPQSADVAVFGFGVSPAVSLEPEDLATRVRGARGSRWLVGSVFRSRRNGSEHYAARRAPGDSTVPAWTPLASLDDGAGAPQLRGDTAYAILRRDADRGRIARRVLGDGPAPSGAWETIVPERRGVITAFVVQQDAIYFTERVGGTMLLHVLPHGARTPRAVALPVTGTVRIVPRSNALAGTLVTVESWAMAPRLVRVGAQGATASALALDDGAKSAAPSTLVNARLEAPSTDGALVPVSIVYDSAALRTRRLDGTAPLLVEAYGGFGQVTDPEYRPDVQVWTALGGVYAYAHVRGGGDLGEAWHVAATRARKQRSVDDVVATVEALVGRGYSSPGRVAVQGISFGAILSGLVPLQRPELLGAAVYDVGGPDEVRAASVDPSAARNIAEIGDVDTPEGIRSLVAASPYHVTPARIALPAMLVHSARDDYNFGTEMLVGKWVARLQAANAGDRPVAWVRTAGGHRWLASLSPEWAATVASFLLWQLGDPRYQPAAVSPAAPPPS